MTVFRRAILAAALCLTGLAAAAPVAAAGDDAFAAAARNLPGFRLISNKPPLPDTVFFDAANKRVSLTQFAGKALLINFWATWCTPCVREMPVLDKLSREFADKPFKVVAIASGSQVGMTPDAFLKEHELSALTLYKDPHARLMALFDTKTLPTTLLADRYGRIVGGTIGEADWGSKEARAVLKQLIESP